MYPRRKWPLMTALWASSVFSCCVYVVVQLLAVETVFYLHHNKNYYELLAEILPDDLVSCLTVWLHD